MLENNRKPFCYLPLFLFACYFLSIELAFNLKKGLWNVGRLGYLVLYETKYSRVD